MDALKASLLWFEFFANTLMKNDFILNPYELCVTNKIVNGKQLIVVWYVGNLKISLEQENVVQETVEMLKYEFSKMSTTFGSKHEYQEMEIEIMNKRVHICIKKYLKEYLKEFGEAINTAT